MRGNHLALASMFLAAAMAAPAFAQVSNGGFEDPLITPPVAGAWQYNSGAVRDGTNPHSGSFEANLNNTTTPGNVNVGQQTIAGSVLPNTQYVLSYWEQSAYVIAGEGQEQVNFLDAGGGFLAGSPPIAQIPAAASYTHIVKTFTTPANTSELFLSFAAVTGAVNGSSSQLYIDDVSFTVVPEPTTIAAVSSLGALGLRRRRIV